MATTPLSGGIYMADRQGMSPAAKSVGAYSRLIDLQNEIDNLNESLDRLADELGPILLPNGNVGSGLDVSQPDSDSDLTGLVNKAGRRLVELRERIDGYRGRVDI